MSAAEPLRVLIVDDNHDAAESMGLAVEAAGHRVQAAYSAGEALGRVRAGFAADAVLTDIGLPGTDGFALARELCGALPRRPLLIAISGRSDLDRRTREEGFEVYFVKPVDPELVLGILEAHAARLRRGTLACPVGPR